MASKPLKIAANVCRIIVGVMFAFSGFVKAVDPTMIRHTLAAIFKGLDAIT